jgi:hypothetical protein
MKGKLVFIAGAAAGYVLGARAGRKRYEQIKTGAEKFWNSPGVQDRVKQVQGFVDDRAPDIQSKVTGGAKKVVDQVTKRTQRGQQKGPSGNGAPGAGATETTGMGGATGAATSGAGTTGSAGTGGATTGSEQPAADTRPPFE